MLYLYTFHCYFFCRNKALIYNIVLFMMCDQSGRFVELMVVSGIRPRVVLVEVMCGNVKVVSDEGQKRTKMWLSKLQLRRLLEMVSPIIIQLLEGGFSIGMKPQVVVGNGLRAALVLRKHSLSMSGVVVGDKNVVLMEDKVVVSVGKVVEDEEVRHEHIQENELISNYFS